MSEQRIWYMRDNHSFAQLPNDVDAAMARLQEVFDGHCGHYGMLATKQGPMNGVVVHARSDWEEFAEQARPWLEAALKPSDADIEYTSWSQP